MKKEQSTRDGGELGHTIKLAFPKLYTKEAYTRN
jgi:hypothetical protein